MLKLIIGYNYPPTPTHPLPQRDLGRYLINYSSWKESITYLSLLSHSSAVSDCWVGGARHLVLHRLRNWSTRWHHQIRWRKRSLLKWRLTRKLFPTLCYTHVGRCSAQHLLPTTTSERTLPTLSDQRICDRPWSITILSIAISLVIRLAKPTWWRLLWWRQRSIGSGRRSVALAITTAQRTKRY